MTVKADGCVAVVRALIVHVHGPKDISFLLFISLLSSSWIHNIVAFLHWHIYTILGAKLQRSSPISKLRMEFCCVRIRIRTQPFQDLF